MLEIGVLADDLTGALASAACLRRGGLVPAVLWSRRQPPPSADCVVVDMRTRDSACEASGIACEWARFLRRLGCRRLEQRIDSALQGRPAADVAGALRGAALSDPLILAVPAFPTAGRRTVDGELHVELAGATPRILDVAGALFPGAEVGRITLASTEAGAQTVATALRRGVDRGTRRFVADATDERHLEILALAAARLEVEGIELLTVSPGAWLRFHPAIRRSDGFVLVVVSSPTEQNRAQTALLRDCARPVNVVETLSEPAAERRRPELAARAAALAAKTLADARSEGRRCLGIVVSGGHTASCLVDALGADGIAVRGEIRPLCPLGILRGGPWDGTPIATKGGLIGSERTLLELVEAVHKEAWR